MKFILEEGAPYKGHVQSVLQDDGTVAWSDGLTLEQYSERRGKRFRVIDEEELRELEREYVSSLITAPVEIDEERYDYALNCLPPCKWQTVRGVQMFHISERITADLVNWYATARGRYFAFADRSSRPAAEIADMIGALL